MARGVLLPDQEITVERVASRETNYEGHEVIHYWPEEQWNLIDVGLTPEKWT
jgi:hypothetical protein